MSAERSSFEPLRSETAAPSRSDAYVLDRAVECLPPRPYERGPNDPVDRELRVYAIDPTVATLEGKVAVVQVPYEPLAPGPEGTHFKIESYDSSQRVHYRRARLDDRDVLLRGGYVPSESDPCFAQQMIYAVCSNVYAAFRRALGRPPCWARSVGPKLRVFPHSRYDANACYDEVRGELHFGYCKAPDQTTDNTLPGGFVFTCLSHDVIVHETTHALLDGMRSHFTVPSGPDVVAFHEAFADLMALFQRFSHKDIVRHAIRSHRGDVGAAEHLTELASQLGHTLGYAKELRSAIDCVGADRAPRQVYDETLEAHDLGAVLVAAVFEAFIVIYRRKTERYIRLATGGSGQLPSGQLPVELEELLSEASAALAAQFQSICIRAIDYCPAVELTFGEYLRAMITADRDLVPSDPWDYRGAIVEAFRRRRIYPRDVPSLSPEAMLWLPTREPLSPIEGLEFSNLRVGTDGASAASAKELQRRARVLGEFISQQRHLQEFGLVASGDARLAGDDVTPPCIHSIRSVRRVGPDGTLACDLIAEITQTRHVRHGAHHFDYAGGSTVIIGADGRIRYAIVKNVAGTDRVEQRRAFILGAGARFWEKKSGLLAARRGLFAMVHRGRKSAGEMSRTYGHAIADA